MSSSGRSRSFVPVCREWKPICLWGPQRAKVHTVFEHWEAQRLVDVKTHCRVSSSMTSTPEVVSITAKTRLRRNNKKKSGLRILSYPAASWPNIHGNSPSGSCKVQHQMCYFHSREILEFPQYILYHILPISQQATETQLQQRFSHTLSHKTAIRASQRDSVCDPGN